MRWPRRVRSAAQPDEAARLRPGDVLVLRYARPVPGPVALRIRAAFADAGVPVVLADGCAELKVRPMDPEPGAVRWLKGELVMWSGGAWHPLGIPARD